MIIEPSKSHVVQVRGSQLIVSKSFPANFTLRFPRFAKLRSDEKGIHEAMTKSELLDYFERFKGKTNALNEETTTRKAKRPRTAHARSVIPSFVGANASNITVVGDIFRGLEFCVMLKSNLNLKLDIEHEIIKFGGSIAQIPSSDRTKMIIANELSK
jgi:DNA ligase-4